MQEVTFEINNIEELEHPFKVWNSFANAEGSSRKG